MMNLKRAIPLIYISLTACDYYYSAMEYKDNDLLGKIYTWDKNINISTNKTPTALEYDGFCFLKKDGIWILLNGRSKYPVVALYEDKIPCITHEEKKWVEKICPSINNNNSIQYISKLICN